MMLPELFKERMKGILKSDADELFEAIEESEAVRAFRVNSIKTAQDSFEASSPEIQREKVSFPKGAYITTEEYPGSLPCHHSGAIYMQDISAMTTVHALPLKEGMKVLDSCSAPGGKTTQMSAAVGNGGIVLANEYDTKRCRILQSNVERMGCRNTVVVNLDTAYLAQLYAEKFDAVLCDAPCSGEGMFRKNPKAVEEWSPQNVEMCAQRQREILGNVSRCVAGGGYLLYSTCTFSLEENEMNVEWFLDTHSDFSLCELADEIKEVTSRGISLDGCKYDMKKTARIYPHLSQGEGQFIALFRREGESESRAEGFENEPKFGKKDAKSSRGGKSERKGREAELLSIARSFLDESLDVMPEQNMVLRGDSIYLCPNITLPEYGLFSAGVAVGEVQKGRLIPHHQLFSAFGSDFKLKIKLSGNSPEAEKYLRGEEIDATDLMCSSDGRRDGWAAVLIDDCPTGGAKVSGGRAKNHYPKGLRK